MDNKNELITAYFPPLFRVRRFPVIREAEARAHNEATRDFRKVIEAGEPFSTGAAYMMTTQEKKVHEAHHFVDHRAPHAVTIDKADIPDFVETQTASAAEAAKQKAQFGKVFTEHTFGSHETFLGADAVHWVAQQKAHVAHPNPVYVQKHKLARRLTPDTEEQRALRLKNFKHHYANPHVRENIDIYDVALVMTNGVTSVANAFIWVWSRPFDEEEIQAVINNGLETGSYYRTNSRGELIEAMWAYQLITGLAYVPAKYWELEGRQADVKPWRQEPTPGLYQVVQNSINATVPSGILGMRHGNNPRR